MSVWIVLWLIWLAVNGVLIICVWSRITDENEAGLPIDARPSWRLFERQPFWVVLAQHRRRYPDSRVRIWAVVSMVSTFALVLVPVLIALMNAPW